MLQPFPGGRETTYSCKSVIMLPVSVTLRFLIRGKPGSMYGTAATTAAHTDKACEWIQEWNDKLVRTSGYENRRQYVNYGNGADVQDPVESLYGHDLWRLEKLRRLKDEYDPENYWRFYQPLVKQEERASGQK